VPGSTRCHAGRRHVGGMTDNRNKWHARLEQAGVVAREKQRTPRFAARRILADSGLKQRPENFDTLNDGPNVGRPDARTRAVVADAQGAVDPWWRSAATDLRRSCGGHPHATATSHHRRSTTSAPNLSTGHRPDRWLPAMPEVRWPLCRHVQQCQCTLAAIDAR